MSLKQFRDRYPKASLDSEILMVQEGQFVVKVTLEVIDVGKSTGLAAAPHLETAEDRARVRALAGFGWEEEATLPEVASVPTSLKPLSNSNGMGSVPPTPLTPSTTLVSDSSPMELSPDEENLPKAASGVSITRPKPTIGVQQPPQPALAVSPDSKPLAAKASSSSTSVKTEANLPPPSAVSPKPEVPSAETNLPIGLPPPIDLSDVISQTSIEMRRLRWTIEDGRRYLQQTYQKNSRNDLTEEELIEFLCYLESLPDPT